jgi:hypothetical protein
MHELEEAILDDVFIKGSGDARQFEGIIDNFFFDNWVSVESEAVESEEEIDDDDYMPPLLPSKTGCWVNDLN